MLTIVCAGPICQTIGNRNSREGFNAGYGGADAEMFRPLAKELYYVIIS
jgi:hypothetical protein